MTKIHFTKEELRLLRDWVPDHVFAGYGSKKEKELYEKLRG